MSECIVVLVTKNPDPEESPEEYRVAYIPNYFDLFRLVSTESKWQPNTETILDTFTECTVFTDLEAAVDYANEVSAYGDELDGGITIISDFKDSTFSAF